MLSRFFFAFLATAIAKINVANTGVIIDYDDILDETSTIHYIILNNAYGFDCEELEDISILSESDGISSSEDIPSTSEAIPSPDGLRVNTCKWRSFMYENGGVTRVAIVLNHPREAEDVKHAFFERYVLTGCTVVGIPSKTHPHSERKFFEAQGRNDVIFKTRMKQWVRIYEPAPEGRGTYGCAISIHTKPEARSEDDETEDN